MQLHQLKSIHKTKRAKRVGRGGKRGAYSGKGIKGQKARAGRKMEPQIRALIKRYPKLRGYRFKARKQNVAVVNLKALQRLENKTTISPEFLIKQGIVRKSKGRALAVKILGVGEASKEFVVQGCLVSRRAREKIEKAGGRVEL